MVDGDADIHVNESPQCLDVSETSEAAMASDLSAAVNSLHSQLLKDDSSFISSGRRGDRPHCDLVLLAGARGEEGLEPGAAPIF